MRRMVLEWPLRGAPMDLPVSASHTLIVPSLEPDRMRRPSGEYATEVTSLVGAECDGLTEAPPGLSTLEFSAADHIRIVLSSEQDTMWRLSGEKLTALTASLCPANGPPSTSNVAKSHMRMLPWSDPEATRLPSEENERDITRPITWLDLILDASWALKSQILTVPSSDAETM